MIDENGKIVVSDKADNTLLIEEMQELYDLVGNKKMLNLLKSGMIECDRELPEQIFFIEIKKVDSDYGTYYSVSFIDECFEKKEDKDIFDNKKGYTNIKNINSEGLYIVEVHEIWIHIGRHSHIKKTLYTSFTCKLSKSIEEFKELYIRKIMQCNHDYIISGPPGAGKSSTLDKQIVRYIRDFSKVIEQKMRDEYTERFLTTSASMHEDLWGCYKPVKNRDEATMATVPIVYKFVPGPFAKLLKKALINPAFNYIMIIEELNRGNASDVLGDLLQLFDRNEEKESQYKISMPQYVRDYFEEEVSNEIKAKLKDGLYLPNNFFVICTMNNSDAGVQAVDANIRRRFDMMYIDVDGKIYGGDLEIGLDGSVETSKREILLTNDTCKLKEREVTRILESINKKIREIRPDKQIAKYFLDKFYKPASDENNESNERTILGKDIIMNVGSYLYSLELSKSVITGPYSTFSDFIKAYSDSDNRNVFINNAFGIND